jgi:hypothetical protein
MQYSESKLMIEEQLKVIALLVKSIPLESITAQAKQAIIKELQFMAFELA